jgi:hypothetical protein
MGDAAHRDLASYNYVRFDEHIAEGGEQEAAASRHPEAIWVLVCTREARSRPGDCERLAGERTRTAGRPGRYRRAGCQCRPG